ncbi:hypothetical protein CKO35_11430 [Ectothiorhodospira shaposhnikovii]|nr:hypothetical protein [Ectothiorhodospira shaposhnikovii]
MNDLHKAAGGVPKDRPYEWLRNSKTKELLMEFETGNLVIKPMTVKAGR